MYPDTDLPPKRITAERLAALRAKLPPRIPALERWYAELGVPSDLIPPLSGSKFAPLFETAVKEWKLAPKLAALVLAQYPKRMKRKGLPWRDLDETVLSAALQAVRDGRLRKEGLLPLLDRALAESSTVAALLAAGAPQGDPAREMDEIAAGLAGKKSPTPTGPVRRAMGLLMAKWRGFVDGADAARRFEARLGQVRP
jgi:glutamyl-tRNA(Gln) amidotransferase subunit E